MASAAAILLQRLKDAQSTLQTSRPKRPSSALDFFAGDLKQQYNLKDEQTSSPEFTRIITEAWHNLSPAERQPYEARARTDMARYLEEERLYDEKQMEYTMLRKAAVDAGLIPGQQQPAQPAQQHQQFLGQLAQRAGQPPPMAPGGSYQTLSGGTYQGHGFVSPQGMLPQAHQHFMDQQQAQQVYFQQQQQQQQRYLLQQQAQAQAAQQRMALAVQQAAQQQQQQQQQWGGGQRQGERYESEQQKEQREGPRAGPQRVLPYGQGGMGGGAAFPGGGVPQWEQQQQQQQAYVQRVSREAAQEGSRLQQAHLQKQQQQHRQQQQQQQQQEDEEDVAVDDEENDEDYSEEPPAKRHGPDRSAVAAGMHAAAAGAVGAPTQPHHPQQFAPLVGRFPGPMGPGASRPGSGSHQEMPALRPRPASAIPEKVEIMCQGVSGTMIIREQRVMCHCSECQKKPQEKRIMSCTQFEAHAGASSAKKWKTSLKVRPGAEPEVPASGNGMQVGKWLELRGIEVGKPVFRAPPGHHMEISKDSMAKPQPERSYASERLQKLQQLQRQRQLESSSDDVLDDEEEAAAAFAMLAGGSNATAAGRSADMPQQAEPAVKVKLESAQGVTAEQLGKRLPGRPPKDGMYKAERVAALYGVKVEKPTEKTQAFEPWNDVVKGNYVPLRVRWAGERCSVCDADTDYDFDQLVTCDLCGITVHQSCYGVPDLPDQGDMWLCRTCELKEEGKPAPQCCLCPVAGGALKPTTIPGLWCHAACLQWIPEVTVEDASVMEPIDGVKSIQSERWNLNCCVCKQRMGAKIQCLSCYTAYHPLCGRIAGLHMEIRDGPDGPDGPIQLISYCPKHCTPQPQLSGVRLVKESEELGHLPDQSEPPQLWNGQPFQLAPTAPLPDCSMGCARAQPLLNWTRQMHGTGTGATTEEAFWIPETPPNPPPSLEPPALKTQQKPAAAAAAAAAGAAAMPSESGHADGGAKNFKPAPPPPKGFPLNLGHHSRGGRGGKGGKGSRGFGSSPASEQKEKVKGPPPQVDLLPLPEGVEETVPINCNGRHARLVIRTQRVLYDGHEIAPSKFEAVCGKADAKKWKCSLWFEGVHGQPVQMMQDWLAEHNLDRKALEALTRNAMQYQAFMEWQAGQVGEVMDAMLGALGTGKAELEAARAAGRDAGVNGGASKGEEPFGHASEGGLSVRTEGDGSEWGGVEGAEEEENATSRERTPAAPFIAGWARSAPTSSMRTSNGAGADSGYNTGGGGSYHANGGAGSSYYASDEGRRGSPSVEPSFATGGDTREKPTSAVTGGEEASEGGDCTPRAHRSARERSPSPQEEEDGEDSIGAALMELGSAERLKSVPTVREGAIEQPASLRRSESTAKSEDRRQQVGAAPGNPPSGLPVADDHAAATRATGEQQGWEASESDPRAGQHARWAAPLSGGNQSSQSHVRIAGHLTNNAGAGEESAPRPPSASNAEYARGAGAQGDRPHHEMQQQREALQQQQQQQQHEPSDGVNGGPGLQDASKVGSLNRKTAAEQLCAVDAVDESVAEVLIQLVDTPALPRLPSHADLAQQAEHDEAGPTKRSSRLAQKRQLREQQLEEEEEEEGDWVSETGVRTAGGKGASKMVRVATLHRQELPQDMHLFGGQQPEALVGRWVRIWWPDDEEWYEGEVKQYRSDTRQHRVWYLVDEQEEWIDLSKEIRNRRLQLLPGPDRSNWPPVPPPVADMPEGDVQLGGSSGAAALAPRGAATIGRRVGIWWEGDGCFYYGQVVEYRADTGRYQLRYDDGDTDWVNLEQERLDWGGGLVVDPTAGPRPDVPETIEIVCNSLRGTFHVKRSFIVLRTGQEMTPTEFERQAGRAAAKKWKTSLRIDKGGGVPGMTVQDWLIRMGIDAPKLPRPSRATLDAIRRRQISNAYRPPPSPFHHYSQAHPQPSQQKAEQQAAAAHAGAPHHQQRPAGAGALGGSARSMGLSLTGPRRGKEGHREGCTCVICKQARRTGKAWGGMSAAAASQAASGAGGGGTAMPSAGPLGPGDLKWTPARHQQGQQGQSSYRWRAGKRAYLQALPQIVGGLGPHQTELHRIPLSRCWTPEDWVVHRWQQTMRQDAKDAAAADVPPGSGPAAAAAAAAAASASALAAQQQLLQAIGAAFGGGGGSIVDSLAPEVSLGYGASTRRALSVKEKVDLCNATERERIAFGKSGIHGWGLFAKVPMKQDSMVIEYRGDLLRRPVADLREAAYRSQGKDCYLFNLDDDLVIDATMAGNIARFTNHCCNPSMYTKILNINGDQRLMFFARFDIQIGQELTYNYRFKAEEGEERLPCNCGAPNCTGFLN